MTSVEAIMTAGDQASIRHHVVVALALGSGMVEEGHRQGRPEEATRGGDQRNRREEKVVDAELALNLLECKLAARIGIEQTRSLSMKSREKGGPSGGEGEREKDTKADEMNKDRVKHPTAMVERLYQ